MFVVILGIVVTIGGSLLGGGLGIFGALTAAEVISTRESDGIATILQTVESSLPAGIDIETQSPASTATPGLASIVAEFGGQEGIGPGFFNDTRTIGIDAEGRIYTGDYSDGRIQVFDSEGNFLSQWDVSQDDYYMVTMAVNRQGIVYLLQTGNIVRFDGPTGAPMEPVAFDQSVRFEKLAVAPDNTLWAVGRDRLVHFNNDGGVLLDVVDPFERVPDFGPFLSYLAVDGAGNVYVLSNESVYKFDSSGAFADRFGGRGDEPGQFMGSASSLAVDGQGNVYVNDFAGIQVFDSNGSYKGIIDVNVTAFDMVFTEQNQLLLMDRNGNRVVTMQPNP
jgi:sugar lactone lactonase YvrE